jgi:hypothetical protein
MARKRIPTLISVGSSLKRLMLKSIKLARRSVVPDEKDGWRVIISIRGRRYLTAGDEQRLADIQRRLRLVYELRS